MPLPNIEELTRKDVAEWIAENGKDPGDFTLWLYDLGADEALIERLVSTLDSY